MRTLLMIVLVLVAVGRCGSVGAQEVAAVRIAVLYDQTTSSGANGTPRLTAQNLNSLILALKGRQQLVEIALGLIRDRKTSPRRLARLRLEPPPLNPTEQPLPRNPFMASKARAEALDAQRGYDARRRHWEESTQRRIDAFRSETAILLALGTDADSTDFNTSIRQALNFLLEPGAPPPQTFLVALSDAQDTVGAPWREIPKGTRVVLVNGVGVVGALAPYNPTMFESIPAAFAYIASNGGTR